MHVRAFSFLSLCARNSLTFAALRSGDGLGPRCQYYRSPSLFCHFGAHMVPRCAHLPFLIWSASFCAPAAFRREVPPVITGGAPSIGACGRDLLRAQPAQGERLSPSPLSPLPQKLASMVLRHCSLLLRLRVLPPPRLSRVLSTPKNRGIFLEIFRGNPGRFSGAVASAAPRLHARPLTDNNATEVIQ